MLVDLTLELERAKMKEVSMEEKLKLCKDVAALDFVRMRAVVDILALGTNQPSLLAKVEVDIDIASVSNVVLREIQYFLFSPTAMTLKDELRVIEAKIATIKSQLVQISFQKVSS